MGEDNFCSVFASIPRILSRICSRIKASNYTGWYFFRADVIFHLRVKLKALLLVTLRLHSLKGILRMWPFSSAFLSSTSPMNYLKLEKLEFYLLGLQMVHQMIMLKVWGIRMNILTRIDFLLIYPSSYLRFFQPSSGI